MTFTLECSGNHRFPFVIGAIGNARWAGTPLAPLLERARILQDGTEVVFWGADSGEVTIATTAAWFAAIRRRHRVRYRRTST